MNWIRISRAATCGLALAVLTGGAWAQSGGQSNNQAQPVAVKQGIAEISAENTAIGFIGTHVGADPKPRKGGFAKFTGQLQIDDQEPMLKSITVSIQTASIWTEFSDLTKHLKTADFFDVDQFPQAEFQSTSIQKGDQDGHVTITGNLTILKTTAEIRFPARLSIDDRGLELQSEFTIDRTAFGMDRLQQGVENVVTVSVHVGKPTPGGR